MTAVDSASRRTWAVVAWVVMVNACVYLNSVFNARRTFDETESARWSGRDTTFADLYDEVIASAEEAYEADPDGKYADDALLLVGQANLRKRQFMYAEQALEEVLRVTTDTVLHSEATLYLGAVAVAEGHDARGISLLDAALAGPASSRARGEGHLWRARAFLSQRRVESGWRDLDRAGEIDARYVLPADLDRLAWSITLGDTARARRALDAMMASPEGRGWGDSVRVLLEGAHTRWGPTAVVRIMAGAHDTPWSRAERDRLLMQRATLAREMGDTSSAVADAGRVARGTGTLAQEARVALGRWRLEDVAQLTGVSDVRGILLPAVGHPQADLLLNSIRRIEILVDDALDGESLAFFVAAEQAREVLGAPQIAASLFQAYVDGEEQGAWVGKALLAARQLSKDSDQQRALDGRLRELPDDPYVRYARDGSNGDELTALEAVLRERVTGMLERVQVTLVARRLLVGADTLFRDD